MFIDCRFLPFYENHWCKNCRCRFLGKFACRIQTNRANLAIFLDNVSWTPHPKMCKTSKAITNFCYWQTLRQIRGVCAVQGSESQSRECHEFVSSCFVALFDIVLVVECRIDFVTFVYRLNK